MEGVLDFDLKSVSHQDNFFVVEATVVVVITSGFKGLRVMLSLSMNTKSLSPSLMDSVPESVSFSGGRTEGTGGVSGSMISSPSPEPHPLPLPSSTRRIVIIKKSLPHIR